MTTSIRSLGKYISSVITKDKKYVTDALINYNGLDWVNHSNYNKDVLFDKRQVYVDDTIDIYVVSWNKMYVNDIHNHSPGGCWMRIMDGLLLENIYDTFDLTNIKSNILNTGNINYIDDTIGYHTITNKHMYNSITLNLHNPSNLKSSIFT